MSVIRNEELNRAIGARVRDLRDGKGLTQKALNKLLGRKAEQGGFVYHVENNGRGLMPADFVVLAEFFGVSIDWIILGGQSPGFDPVLKPAEIELALQQLAATELERLIFSKLQQASAALRVTSTFVYVAVIAVRTYVALQATATEALQPASADVTATVTTAKRRRGRPRTKPLQG